MDKRWIYILIILIVGIGCLYLIACASNTVGTANVNVGIFTVTLPDNFNIKDKDNGLVQIIDWDTLEYIIIGDLDQYPIKNISDDEYSAVNEDSKNILIKNETIKVNNRTLKTIYYENTWNKINRICFTSMHDHTIVIELKNYTDNTTLNNDLKYVLDSMRPDYKQKID